MNQGVQISRLNLADLLQVFLLILALLIAFWMLTPFLDAIIIAGLFAVLMNPLYQRLLSLLGGRRSLTAFLTALLLTGLVLIPLFLVLWRLSQETVGFLQSIVQWLNSDAFQEFLQKPVVRRFLDDANRYLSEFRQLTVDRTGQDLQLSQLAVDMVASIAKRIADQGSYVAVHSVTILGNFLLMIFAFFFMIRDQEELRRTIFRLLPFTRGYEHNISTEVVQIIRSTFFGIFVTALAQALGAAVGFWITGIPVLFGAFATAFASLIPVIGTGIVWLPATLYLLFTGHIGSAVFLTIWWAVVVAFLLDNLLRPLLISGGKIMHMPLVLLFILGGIHLFGLPGVLYGPLILGSIDMLFYLYDLNLATAETKPEQIIV